MLMSQKVQQFFRLCQQSVVSICKIMFTHITYGTWFCGDSLSPKGKISIATESPLQKCNMIFSLIFLLHILVCYSPHTLYPISHPNQDPSAYPQPTSQDLAGLWDLLQLNIEDVRVKFQDLHRLKDSGWRLPPEKKVRGPGVQTALVSLQHSPRAKMAVCRRVAQMVVPSKSLQAVKVQSSKRNWAEMPITVES